MIGITSENLDKNRMKFHITRSQKPYIITNFFYFMGNYYVIVTCRNSESTIERAILSLQNQTTKPEEETTNKPA